MTDQIYEKYWKLTVEYSDINGKRFLETLRLIVEFVDKTKGIPYSPQKYKDLQLIINKAFPKKDMGSVRKSINQFIKFGFINFQLASYHPNTKEFLDARTS